MQSDPPRVAESATTNAELNQTSETFSRDYRAWLLFVLMLVNLLNLADRQGLAAVVPALKVDPRLSDTQLGLILGLGFAIFYTLLRRRGRRHRCGRWSGSCWANDPWCTY
jgi:hypothetical protein